MASKVADMVTSQVVKGLEHGIVPWRKPWRMSECANFSSGRRYTGVNPWLLHIECMRNKWAHPLFATFNQITAMGGTVRKGEHGTMVVFTKQQMVDKEITRDGETKVEQKAIYLLRYYKVFNLAQTDGLGDKVAKHLPTVVNHDTVAEADDIISASGADIRHGGGVACYSPDADTVFMPDKNSFDTNTDYYHTTFHELIHWTGHESRFNRLTGLVGFSIDNYAQEELVAECGACMLGVEVGIVHSVRENDQAYINGWLSKIKGGDAGMVLKAASQADKAADYIVGLRNAA